MLHGLGCRGTIPKNGKLDGHEHGTGNGNWLSYWVLSGLRTVYLRTYHHPYKVCLRNSKPLP